MLLSLFGYREPGTRRANKRARQSSSSSLTRLCFSDLIDQSDSSSSNLSKVEKGGADMMICLPSGYINTRLKGVTRDVYVIPVSPSRIRKFHVQFYIRKGTTDEQVIEEVIKTNCYQRRYLKGCLSDTQAQV